MVDDKTELVEMSKTNADTVRREAIHRGMSFDRYVQYVTERARAPVSPAPVAPARVVDGGSTDPMERFNSTMRTMSETMPMILMTRALGMPMGAAGGPMGADPAAVPITRRDLEEWWARRRHRDDDDDEMGESPVIRRMERMMTKRAEWAMLLKFTGEGSTEGSFAKDMMARYDTQLAALQAENKVTQNETRERLDTEKEARHAAEVKRLEEDKAAYAAALALAQNPPRPPPGSDAGTPAQGLIQMAHGLRDAQTALNELRATYTPPPQAPPGNAGTMDKIGYMIDKVSMGIREGLQGAGAFAAGQRGIPPDLLGMVPSEPEVPLGNVPQGYPGGNLQAAPPAAAAAPPGPTPSSGAGSLAAGLGAGGERPPPAAPAPTGPVSPAGPVYYDNAGQRVTKAEFDTLNAEGRA